MPLPAIAFAPDKINRTFSALRFAACAHLQPHVSEPPARARENSHPPRAFAHTSRSKVSSGSRTQRWRPPTGRRPRQEGPNPVSGRRPARHGPTAMQRPARADGAAKKRRSEAAEPFPGENLERRNRRSAAPPQPFERRSTCRERTDVSRALKEHRIPRGLRTPEKPPPAPSEFQGRS